MAIYDDVLGGDGEPRIARPRSIALALKYLRQRLHEPLDVATLADVAGLSRSHFSRVFATAKGVAG